LDHPVDGHWATTISHDMQLICIKQVYRQAAITLV